MTTFSPDQDLCGHCRLTPEPPPPPPPYHLRYQITPKTTSPSTAETHHHKPGPFSTSPIPEPPPYPAKTPIYHFLLINTPCWSVTATTFRIETASTRLVDTRDARFGNAKGGHILAFPDDNNNSLKKIPKLEDPAAYSRLGLMSVPQEVVDTHELQSITLDFKRECQHDDIVDSLTSPEPLNVASNGSISFKQDGKNLSRFLHLLRSSSDVVGKKSDAA
ncbi:acyl-ACP thioesterase [Tanacetum coccineum]